MDDALKHNRELVEKACECCQKREVVKNYGFDPSKWVGSIGSAGY